MEQRQRFYTFDGENDHFLVKVEGEKFDTIPPPPIPLMTEPDGDIDYEKFVPLPIYHCTRWAEIGVKLSTIFSDNFNVEQLPDVIKSYTGKKVFSVLKTMLNEETFVTFEHDKANCSPGGMRELIRQIAKLALRMNTLFPRPIPLLRRNTDCSLTLSQEQCACILANGFFCTFSERLRNNDVREIRFNKINFNNLFHVGPIENAAKLKCILYYFYQITKKMPCGTVTFMRTSQPAVFSWHEDENFLTNVTTVPFGLIEKNQSRTQVDFANEYIGGDVLGWGSVQESSTFQEEIRFITCPEMIVSCLVCERMARTESIRIIGAETYSGYFGYSKSFSWRIRRRSYNVPRDELGRYKCEVLAIDALNYRIYDIQYHLARIHRELNKAYSGFSIVTNVSVGTSIATGNWGCGAFKGDKELKSMIQYLAASRAHRDLVYYTFGDEGFARSLDEIVDLLHRKKIQIQTLYKWIVDYSKSRDGTTPLFRYLMQQLNAQ